MNGKRSCVAGQPMAAPLSGFAGLGSPNGGGVTSVPEIMGDGP